MLSLICLKYFLIFWECSVIAKRSKTPCHQLSNPEIKDVNVDPDELHVMHLGVWQYALGSVLWLLCYKGLKLAHIVD